MDERKAEFLKAPGPYKSGLNTSRSAFNISIVDWDCFVAVAEIGEQTIPVIFKIRITDRDIRSQIYRMDMKNEIGSIYDDGSGKNAESVRPNYDGTPISESKVSENKESVKQYSICPEEEPAVEEVSERSKFANYLQI